MFNRSVFLYLPLLNEIKVVGAFESLEEINKSDHTMYMEPSPVAQW